MTTGARSMQDELAQMRAKGGAPTLSELVRHCQKTGIPVIRPDLLAVLTEDHRYLDRFVPSDVAEFIADLAALQKPDTILEPLAGKGFLATALHARLKPSRMRAVTQSEEDAEVWTLLGDVASTELVVGDPLDVLADDVAHYDMVVSCPPWGLHEKRRLKVDIGGRLQSVTDHAGHLLILAACQHLTEHGCGVFVVFDGFFTRSGSPGRARHALEQLGLFMTAAIELPEGTFEPLTRIATHIVLLERAATDTVFTARYASSRKQQQAILDNLQALREGKSPSLGCVVERESFRGFSPIDVAARIKDQARRSGLKGYPFREVVQEVNAPARGKSFARLPELPNCVYLPAMAATKATTSQSELPEKLKSYYQLVVNPDVADARFVARMLNTSLGQQWRGSLRTGTTIPRINRTLLEESTVYLPVRDTLHTQQSVVDAQRTIDRLKNELGELESKLWSRPLNVDAVANALATLNQKDRFQDWIDTLPFPLASILWVCHAQGGSATDQYKRKLHFFEALAEFLAVVLLSAFASSPKHWAQVGPKVQRVLNKQHLTLRMATFGAWKVTFEVLSAEVRRLRKDDPSTWQELFHCRNDVVVDAISDPRLVQVIQTTNAIRNDWLGHMGAVPEKAAWNVDGQLKDHIETVRNVFGVIWEQYMLITPLTSKYQSGVFKFQVRHVMGARTPFAAGECSLTAPLEDGHLHLWSPSEETALKLLPLVKVMPSPRTESNACYFYNRCEQKGVRFLSYHFEPESEIVNEFADVTEALSSVETPRTEAPEAADE